uniref:SurA N-terminal domain-containing protein n=1 Tax=Altererythrobacter segetis TaxID=1104773 RepID=UPI00140AF0FB|nr:SurA N-terminal domain-containing protein [Altererythrobacter segetis]
MLQFFRNFFKSKFGVIFTIAFLIVIAIAFGVGDIASNQSGGGIAGGDRVAVVGDKKISASDLSQAMTTALENEKQQNPTLTMEGFIAGGGMDRVLDQILQRTALAEYAHKQGLRAGKRLVDSELVQIQAFQGIDGKFDRNAFLTALRQRGLSEELVRNDVAAGLYARQMLIPASYSSAIPRSLAQQYAMLLKERRKGAIAILPSGAYAPKGDPAAAQLNAFYSAHRTDYLRPERRVIRYATFGEEALATVPPPTDAQIAARYQRDAAQYQAKQTRTFTQLVLPTEAAAKAVAAEVAGGTSLAAAAASKSLATTKVGPVTQGELAAQSSQAVANAAFAESQGTMIAPTRGGLGWYLLRVDAVENTPARSLAQVRDEIAKALAEEQRKAAFADLAANVEDQLDNGGSLADVAKRLKLEIETTEPITADGRVYGKQETAPPVLARALKTAFEMEEGQPQLAEVDPGKTYLVFETTGITPSSAAPLAEIRDEVVLDWRKTEGAKAAKAAAQRVMQRLSGGQDIAAALAAEKISLPPPNRIDLSRDELAKQGQVPPVMALMFSMAKGTVKRLEAPQNNGWFVVKLDDVALPPIDKNDPLIGATQQQLVSVFGDEYSEELVHAAQRAVGVTKNQPAIDAVRKQLTGRSE